MGSQPDLMKIPWPIRMQQASRGEYTVSDANIRNDATDGRGGAAACISVYCGHGDACRNGAGLNNSGVRSPEGARPDIHGDIVCACRGGPDIGRDHAGACPDDGFGIGLDVCLDSFGADHHDPAS